MDKHFYDKDVHKLPPAPPRFYCCGVKHDLDKTYGRAETLKENVIPQDKYVFWGIHSPQLYVERLTLVHLFQRVLHSHDRRFWQRMNSLIM